MIPLALRWVAAAVAALVFIGVGVAVWVTLTRVPAPEPQQPDEPFKLQAGLADDGRIGKVTDVQGVVAVKPVTGERWSPVQPRLVLKPGDWVRTDARGANAVTLRLLKSNVVVGPHSTLELVKADEYRLSAGEIEIDAPDAVELTGPDKQKVSVKGRQVFRVEKEKLVRVEAEPKWLQGFKGASASESLGSLVATVDGRDVPLTVGYHHVTVDIRDQIARTTVEESFVNTTANTLEGVFHFPLPQDASISGFGMWIGNELVEADVVEKQRAREIYEDILRSNRDPALLEWAGGNIFKARVFPIPGRSEKRIKITYTQVLPLQGNRYRYSYGLQSELLKQKPLRDLKIDVKVNSASTLKGISSPTHPARVARTEHSGQVEFSAQEYTPTRDFEAVIEVDAGRADVVVVPHRRGDDGYFMVQLTPPGAAGDWERPLVPSGDPLRLILLADTSASMDKGQRANQNAVLAALLGALTEKDTINVGACDVNCDWAFEKAVPATPANVAAALNFVEKRTSLGWTDLDKAFASALARSAAGTHVIYLGDGASTTGKADPVAFAKRLQRLYEGKAGTVHAVALGNSYEPAALKAIAQLGGGSVRKVAGDRGPQATALDLLTEIASPSLRDVKVQFNGLRTARVYPEVLPNVPAGTQQILLGRYLPEGKDQSGEIVVTGTLNGKPVRYVSKVSLKDAEQGNSFVPRLWARMHLDSLLEQGPGAKADVIALSEEFHIITPYTSFLVLESDADRARYAVQRRFQMRDGERFFQDGRDQAAFDLKQKQMRLAGEHRTALRRQVLADLNRLGRDARLFRQRPVMQSYIGYNFATLRDDAYMLALGDDYAVDFAYGPLGSTQAIENDFRRYDVALGVDDTPAKASPIDVWFDGAEKDMKAVEVWDRTEPLTEDWAGRGLEPAFAERITTAPFDGLMLSAPEFDGIEGGYLEEPGLARMKSATYSRRGRYRGPQLQWLGTLFPALPPARAPRPQQPTWPADALALSKSLLRTDALAALKGGLVVTRQTDSFNRDEVTSRLTRVEVVSPTAWLGRTTPTGGPVSVEWCDAQERGAYNAAFLLGRTRAAAPGDLRQFPLELGDNSVVPLHETYANMTAAVEALAKDRALLTLKYPNNADYELRVVVDTARKVVVSYENRSKGKPTGGTRFGDFVEVAGTWWAQRVEALDEKGARHGLTTQTITEVAADAFARRFAQELAEREKVLFLRSPLPPLTEAKSRAAAGKATFDDRATLVLHFAASQQWARAAEHFAECEKLAAGKGGLRWLRDAFLLAARKHDDLRKRLLDEGAALATAADAGARANEYFLAEHLLQQGQQVLTPAEQLELLTALKNVFERQPGHLGAVKAWRVRQAHATERGGDLDKALPLWKALATDFPRDVQLQQSYARQTAQAGDYPAAYAWLDAALKGKWEPGQEESLRDLYVDLLRQQSRHRDMATFLAEWLKREPQWDSPYARYLTALVRSNQAKRAEEVATEWLKAGLIEGELPRPVAARVRAATGFMLGNGHELYTNRADEKWLPLLSEAALHFARRDDQLEFAAIILGTSRFTNTDPGRAARKALAERLFQEVGTLPLARLDYSVNWAWDGERTDDWKTLAAGLRKRWDAEKEAHAKHHTGVVLARVLSWLGNAELLPFLRAQLKDGPAAYRAAYARDLFDALLALPWTAETEDEAFALLDKLTDDGEPARRLFARVAALHRLTDAMLDARFNAAAKKIEHPEKLPRPELQKKHDELRKQAREGFAGSLRTQAARFDKPFAAWLVAERVWLDVLLERDPKAVAADCWAALPPVPKGKPEDAGLAALDDLLRARFLTALTNLAARKSSDAALIERLLKYFDEQAGAHPDDPRWRGEKYRLLIALDRAADLEAELRRWTADGDNRWRVALGYLLAEQGKVAEAVALFEQVEAADELPPDAYRSLSAWYLVEGRRAEHEKARVAVYKTTDEYQLQRRLNGLLQPWQYGSGRPPSQLDAAVLDLFAVLFEKSATPQNHLDALRQFYVASRDFRLLSALADGVVGHTAGTAYPFVQGMLPVLTEVRDEATADELVKRLAEVRKAAKTPVDQRALDMLELLVERRAAELQNQPGPHADKALAALERAFKREWAAGEPRLMADFLAALGKVPQPAVAKEQLRQLEALHRDAAKGSFDRLRIAQRYAEALWGYGRRSDATDLLLAGLKEFEEANAGVLPASANDTLALAVAYFESAEQYERAEKLLLEQLKHPVHAEQRDWLDRALGGVYLTALRNKGSVSLGAGETLYKALERKLIAALPAAEQPHRYRLLDRLSDVYRAAHRLQYPTVAADLARFTADTLPPILREQTANYEYLVREYGDTVAEVRGPRNAIAFLLDRAADEPDWLRYTNQDGWNLYAARIGEWRKAAKDLGDLEPRLLAFVLAELRRDLRTQSSRSSYLYDSRHSHYWPEKADEFARVADEVLAERKNSSATAEYVAGYLFLGLKREKRAIEALLAAHTAKVLSEGGQSQLADYLHRTGRHAESIPLLQKLIESHGDNLAYRTRLMHAYFRTDKQKELLALLKDTDERWHKNDYWTDHVLAVLGESTLENRLFAQSVAYYEELIPRYQRAYARSGDGALSGYYGNAARAYAGLGNTKKAVDMASGAVVSWGPNADQRKRALEALVAVLVESPDLGRFVAELDKEKLQSAIVRKAIGQAYIRKNDPARAIPQLQLASELQPNDAETYTLLVESFDKLGDAEKGAEVLLRAVELSRRDLALYERLGHRYADLKRPAEAERAFTSMAEVQPQESESHAALAAVREKQKRWDEAIAHWERVAELRALEPTGLIGVAAVQVKAGRWDDAAATVRKVRARTWPARFAADLNGMRDLERVLESRPKR